MTTLAVTFYDVVLWLHIAAVVVGLGSTFAYAVLLAVAGNRFPRAMPGLYAGLQANDRSIVTIGAIVVLLTGIYLAADRWDFSEFFIAWGVLAALVLLGMVHGLFIPTEKRAQQLAERDLERGDQLGSEFNAENARFAKLGTAAGLLIVVTVYVMAAKPFL